MSDRQSEALVIVGDGDYEDIIRRLRIVAVVTQLLPPRLALVASPTGAQTATPDIPGIAWYENDVPATVFDSLSEQERLFVDAWRSRRRGKERTGNHLPWDAPGYLPPDGPKAQ